MTDKQLRRHIRTSAPPAGLRITAPFESVVWASSVPAPVQRYGKTIFRVIEFLPDGIVIGDQSPGLTIRGEISYSSLSPIIPTPPQEPEPPPEPGAQYG